jgi:hypothetical protein
MEAKENCSFMRGNSMSEKGFNRFCKTTISLFLLALVFILAPASGWASDNRVQQRQAILVICDYLEMDDLSKPELIHLHNFFGEGSVALLNTNTAGGHDVTKLKFVVGNTNPRFQTNLEFAKQLKAAADKKYPGIIQGILVISSDFNQDLAPRAMLIEAGAHTNEREHAEQGIAMFAETLPAVLGSPRASEAPPTPEESSGAWKAVILGIILVAAAVFGYLYMNTGSIEGATNQLRNFFSRIPLRRKD